MTYLFGQQYAKSMLVDSVLKRNHGPSSFEYTYTDAI